jgi:hypothetical protein
MRGRGGFGVFILGLLLLTAIAPGMASCSSSSSGAGLAANCSINSDCNNPLICTFSRCHEACAASRDCSDGERCVLSGTIGSCQLETEATCTGASSTCSSGQVCGTDKQCRAECTPTAGGCAMGDYCLPSGTVDACFSPTTTADEPALIAAGVLGPDGAATGDGSVGTGPVDGAISEGGSSALDGTAPEGATGGCATAQTTFASTSVGDANPYFTSGVGARTAKQLIVFDSYVGPDPAGDGGGNNVGLVYAQGFDPGTGASTGPAQPLFTAKDLSVPGNDVAYMFTIMSSAIAPTGEIVLVYSIRFYLSGLYDEGTALYAAFLGPAGDAGVGLQLVKSVQLETSAVYGQPHVIWSNASSAFILSWAYELNGDHIKIQKYLASGLAAGGDIDVVPTDDPSGLITNTNYEGGAVGVSGNLYGVAYQSNVVNAQPELTVLDALGNPVGAPFGVAPANGSDAWVAVAGTSQGFVYFYDNAPSATVEEVFLPASVDAGVVGAGSDASTFGSFALGGDIRATSARAISDDMGGVGGVGVDLLYPQGVSFAYINADGVGHQGPNQVFAHTAASGDYTSMTNFDGSFVVSLYVAANHLTQVSASSCSP